MNILLCNDDGIHANGMAAMFDALINHAGLLGGPLGQVMVVAPLTVQSATGHGITFRQPLITREVDVNDRMSGIGVDGRPADCVKLALSTLWPARFGRGTRPDLVVSGMNQGANVGINVLYSGTVAAALEAAFLGVPSIAVSLHLGAGKPRYDVAAQHARRAIDRVLAAARAGKQAGTPSGLLPGSCLSINVPITEHETPMPGISVAPMNVHGMVDDYIKNTNPLGEVYYWSNGQPMEFHALEPGSDVQALLEGRLTITPLKFDLSDYAALAAWKTRLPG